MTFPERHNLISDLDGGKAECEECGHLGAVDDDGLCDVCAEEKENRPIIALGRDFFEDLNPMKDNNP